MGKVVTRAEFQRNGQLGFLKPILYCCQDWEAIQNAVPVNVMIAERLAAVKPERRTFRIPGILDSILSELPEGTIISDFDVLFHPAYQIDVLQLLIVACKKRTFSAVWPGTYRDGRLIYAEAGYPDFKIYEIEKYDVTCII